MAYPKNAPDAGVPASPSLPEVERRVLDYWANDKTFVASVEARDTGVDGANEYVFYDGPPFANGLPHYGHLLTGYVKDVVPRYQTMLGRRVERRFGWDCHGLPAEVEAEKQLGLSTKQEILELGVAKFNEACKVSVLKYTQDWERYVTRQARWVDFANDYKTLDLSYMESVMWAFKSLHDKGLIYEGFRVLAYCWRCETPLSNTETRMDDVYRDRQDPALTVWFRLLDKKGAPSKERIAVWTTTPWTLPSNLALAVGPDIAYAVLEKDGEKAYVGEARLGYYAKDLEGWTQTGTVKGRKLAGRRYQPLFDFLVERGRAERVPGARGGLRHHRGRHRCRPPAPRPSARTTRRCATPTESPPWSQWTITPSSPRWSRRTRDCRSSRRTSRSPGSSRTAVWWCAMTRYTHSYPHCWRCDTPLVYKAVSSWFVAVTQFRDRMVELNQEITWVPGHVKDGSFGKWLANARDWSISRNRFWGSPIPVWRSDDPAYPRVDVYGSLAELRAGLRRHSDRPAPADGGRAGPAQPGRPDRQVDDASGAGGARLLVRVRVDAVRPGALPVRERGLVRAPLPGRLHRRVHRTDPRLVLHHARARHGAVRPAGVPQLRQSTASCTAPTAARCPRACATTRTSTRCSTCTARTPCGGCSCPRRCCAAATCRSPRRRSGTRCGTCCFHCGTCGTSSRSTPTRSRTRPRPRTDSTNLLDRYVLAKTGELVSSVTEQMDAYDISGACQSVRSYLDALTNWYVRRSRDRFWSGDRDAFDTLYTVLETLSRVVAPLAPMTAEEIWRGLTGERSVHLASWPVADDFPADHELVSTMDSVRDVCSAALSLRKARSLRVRLPLRTLTVATPAAAAPASRSPTWWPTRST